MRNGRLAEGETLYLQAARAEAEAFTALDPSKTRTAGITAISAASLYHKGKASTEAEKFVVTCLSNAAIPEFAREQLKNVLQAIWSEAAILATGMTFSKRDILVSVKGGDVVTGGAPLDLILRKVEEVRAFFYRTVEMLMQRDFRARGGPPMDIQRSFRPWLFQAAPGSYQFAVRLESIAQLELPQIGGPTIPGVEVVTLKFLEIVNAAATDPDNDLIRIVPNPEYRGAFMKLARNLAPTGKGYSSLEIRSGVDSSAPLIVLAPETRQVLTDSIRQARPAEVDAARSHLATLTGILRALHLDEDWLEVTVNEAGRERHIRVFKAGEAIDDVVGPMVNRPVVVETTISASGKHQFVDIQAVE